PDQLGRTCFVLHPSLEIVSSPYPVVTILEMNTGAMELGPVTDWRGEDALIVRPVYEVIVRRLSLGARIFLQSLADNKTLAEASAAASAACGKFDVAENLAALFSGLAIAMTSSCRED